MNKRRNFLKGAGIFGLFAAGATAPVVVHKMQEAAPVLPTPTASIDPKVLSVLEEQAPPTLELRAAYGEIAPPPPPPTFDGLYMVGGAMGIGTSMERMRIDTNGNTSMLINQKKFVEGTESHHSVKMVPGPDGELYVQINGQWKRLLTT